MRDAKALSRHVPTLRSVELVRASIEPAVAGAAAHRHATARIAVLYTKHHAFDSIEDKMAAAIGQSGAAFARALQGPAKSVTRCSRTQFQRMRAQRPAFTPAVRSFTASARSFEKRYTEDHEWIDTSNPEAATIGISTYAAKALGDVVYVELPQIDMEVNKGDAIGAVESVKSASDIMTPVSGVITEVNSSLEEKPSKINSSPEGDGWLAKVKMTSQDEVQGLMDAEAYRKFTEESSDK
ncbi:hypothetical protein D0865_11376 [Hortaea werneckii]|uniref:Glycine cleavage system H protein n=1 Tax=Hortaea werneckii TaxID=91943 RepID=A0A3M7BTX2_HORWE|nr:hypothetical protein D0865_11376 [Hortaea werneckii]